MANIAAHITGVVAKVEVAVGAQVQPGDAVVTLESMKMLIQVEAEGPGKVAQVLCSEGQTVEEGDVLVVLE